MADHNESPGTGDAAAVTALEQRISELEAENARLWASASASASPGRPDKPTRPRRYPRGSWWRALLSAICIVLATIIVPVSVVGAWTRAELVDEDKFVATLGPLASDPAVQNMVIDETMQAIEQQVDFQQLTSDVVDGVAGLNGMPDRAKQALELLKAPAANGLQNIVETAVTKVVQSPAFSDVWNTAVRGAHRALTTVATSDNTGAFVLTPDGLGLNLGPIVAPVQKNVRDQGVGVAGMIPTVNKVIIVGDGSKVTAVQTVYSVAVTAGWWLPFVALGLFLVGILIARRRSLAVLGSGIGLFLGAGALAIGFDVGRTVVGLTAAQLKVSSTGLDVVYEALVADMQHTATIAAVVGVFVAVLAWALGSWSSSKRMRGVVGGGNASARSALARRGLDTGRFGELLYRFRTGIHIAAIVIGIVWLLLLRPLSFGDIVMVVLVMLLVTWVLELLQKRPDEGVDAAGDPVAATADGSTAVAGSAPATADATDTEVIDDEAGSPASR